MRVAMISYHTCPLATLGGKDTGGMNVYVRDLSRELGRRGVGVDVFTRSQDDHVPHVLHDLGYGNRIVHVRAGPETPLPKERLADHLGEFVAGVEAFAQAKGTRYDLIHSTSWLPRRLSWRSSSGFTTPTSAAWSSSRRASTPVASIRSRRTRRRSLWASQGT